MKKYVLILSLIIAGFTSCKKEKTVSAAEQAAIDDKAIQEYLVANPSITAIKDPTGIYYQILTEGSGANPTLSSTVTVNYVGKFLSTGKQFDAGTGFRSSLTGLIQGWQIGIPKAKAGGRVLLIVPSGLAYGANDYNTIPGNSNLVFTIDLLSFN